ncbi:Ca2+-binding RTX toxin-like protein [Sphingomonas naasensis]|uniref:Cadherin domain-containing protein n=1 Tax=Sphingomonas naasensis TaxID=1344951 RepID=A0A4S1WUT1_9SPHN|nr:hypothetical protein [Sphingomonas naasensis]NIJ19346.1 Ca2+-binding RTX toxin-like protein [Sphingomonas naasensis]TGX46515.1 hypothetical protein E5A74_05065 [Sphingomonas naasensis]
MSSYGGVGAASNVNTQTAGDQLRQSVTRLADGSLIAVWETTNTTQDGSGSAIIMRHLSATGVPIGSEVVVNSQTAGSQTKAQVSALAGGGYVVTWQTADTTQDGSGTAVKAQIFDAAGAAVGSEFRVNSFTSLDQLQPTVTGLADGSFVVAWHSTDTSRDGAGWALEGQRFSASGAALGSEFRINSSAFGSQNNADIAALANGGFVVTWQIGNSGSSNATARVYDANGVAQGNDILVTNSVGELDTTVVALADGGFAVAYARGSGIFFQRFDAARAKVGAEVYVGDGLLPEIATLTEGGFVIGWRANGSQMQARAYDATGVATSAAFTLNTDTNTGIEGSLVGLAGGGFASFSSSGSSGTGTGQDVRVQIFQPLPNVAPELGAATRNIAIAENGTTVATITATDDGSPSALTYSIFGGADAARFTINATTGALRFAVAPNYEAPTDAGGNNVYDVIVRASDGALADTQAIAVTVTNVNEAPVISSNGGGTTAAITLAENSGVAATVVAADPESTTLVYSISGGVDAARFAINAATGVLSFVANPDFEAPADSGGDNVYNVIVRASDGSLVDTQTLTITVQNANEAPAITSPASFAASENDTLVGVMTSSDPEGTAASWSIAGGADAALFSIDATTGELRFVDAPDFEAPGDADGDNVYDVVVRASDGSLSTDQALTVTVGNVNEGVTFTSLPLGEAVALFRPENAGEVFTFTAADADGDAVSYTLSGADAALFTIDAATGAVSFVGTPDYEAPGSSGGTNNYVFTVTASDGVFSASRAVGVGVYNVNEGLSITSNGGGVSAAIGATENSVAVTTVTASDLDGDTPVFAIAGGADAALFSIDAATGALAFVAAPDFEAPGDADGDNVYDVVVSAGDGSFVTAQTLAVSVGNVNEGVAFTTLPAGEAVALFRPENGSEVFTFTAADADGDAVSYSLSGADAALFAIDAATGAVSFVGAPDFEAPGSSGGTNNYFFTVTASDGALSASRDVGVGVYNVNEGLAITSGGGAIGVAENGVAVTTVTASDLDGDTPVFAIAGGADAALFSIDAATGALAFVAAPDFEAPGDADGDNVYDVVVSAGDGAFVTTQALAVTIGNVNEGLAIASFGGGASAGIGIAENGTAIGTVFATDSDGDAISYAIAGGADAARFAIDANSGALRFVAAPDFEAPGDAGGDNVYDVIVSASDGGFVDTQALAVTVLDLREGNVITGTNAANTISTSTSASGQPRATQYEDSIYGLGGNDTISAAGGADFVDGGAGNDKITGGAGADILTGGAGADRFIYTATGDSQFGAMDVITDFSRSQTDRIDLSAIDARSTTTGNQSFAFIGTAAFSHVAGQLRYEQHDGSTFVSADVNGDGAADFALQLNGSILLTTAEFVL